MKAEPRAQAASPWNNALTSTTAASSSSSSPPSRGYTKSEWRAWTPTKSYPGCPSTSRCSPGRSATSGAPRRCRQSPAPAKDPERPPPPLASPSRWRARRSPRSSTHATGSATPRLGAGNPRPSSRTAPRTNRRIGPSTWLTSEAAARVCGGFYLGRGLTRWRFAWMIFRARVPRWCFTCTPGRARRAERRFAATRSAACFAAPPRLSSFRRRINLEITATAAGIRWILFFKDRPVSARPRWTSWITAMGPTGACSCARWRAGGSCRRWSTAGWLRNRPKRSSPPTDRSRPTTASSARGPAWASA